MYSSPVLYFKILISLKNLTNMQIISNNIVNFTISEEEKISYKLLEDIQAEETPKVMVNLEFRNDILKYRIAFYRRKKDISNLFNNNFLNE